MLDIGTIELSSGLLTWIIGQDLVIADEVAARIFGLDESLCSEGIEIGAFLAHVVEDERGRVARRLYDTIATGGVYRESLQLSVGGLRRTILMKGRSVGDVLFTCIVAPVGKGNEHGKLQDLCLAAYDVARQENNDAAALQLVKTLSLLGTSSRSVDDARTE
ncbi:hypothetical protein ACC756_17020 [Rhizobium ruizarguesonis]